MKVETGLESMKSEFDNMKNMLGRIFEAVLGDQINNTFIISSIDNNITSSRSALLYWLIIYHSNS